MNAANPPPWKPSQELLAAFADGELDGRGELAELRARLNRNRLQCALFDSARFTRNLEALFTTMWQRHASGQPPTTLGPLSAAAQPNPA